MSFKRGPLWKMVSDALQLSDPLGKIILPQVNDAANPTLAFGDGDSGIYEESDDVLIISLGGVALYEISAAGIMSVTSSGPGMLSRIASATNPTLVPKKGNTNTGVGSDGFDQLTLVAGGAEGLRVAYVAGVITLSSPVTYVETKRLSSSAIAGPAANPPARVLYGITPALEFTLNTDHIGYKLNIPDDYVTGTDIEIRVVWTKSTTTDDQSAKFAKWQLKYLPFECDENVNSAEATLTVEDEYPSAVTDTQLAACSGNMTIPSASIAAGDIISLQLMAVTPAGTALDDEPAALSLEYDITRNVLHG